MTRYDFSACSINIMLYVRDEGGEACRGTGSAYTNEGDTERSLALIMGPDSVTVNISTVKQ